MILSLLPHFLGVCCVLYALQLVRSLYQDARGKRFARNLLAFIAGLASVALAVVFVLGVDYVYPVGSAATTATFFVRLCFLIPLAYLAAFLSSLFLESLIGRYCTDNIIGHMAYLGVTLIILAPVAHEWFLLATSRFGS